MSFTPPIYKPLVTNQTISNPNWLAGFTEGDGSFGVNIKHSSSNKIGYQVYLQFDIIQHVRDVLLLQSFVDFFNCGNVYRHSENAVTFKVTKFSDIKNIIIPFYKQHPLYGVKSKDFHDFCLVFELINSKAHLTLEGVNQIRIIKARMNTGRKF